MDWLVRSSSYREDPGTNFFSLHPRNVWLDDQDRLHLRLTQRSGQWDCAEVSSLRSFGYGTYRLHLDSLLNDLDPNVVMGMFIDARDATMTNEIDIEFARWSNPTNFNAWYTVQPWSVTNHQMGFSLPSGTGRAWHSFTWEPNRIWWNSRGDLSPFPGLTIVDAPLSNYLFTGSAEVPKTNDERIRLNLWLFDNRGPADGREVEVVIRKVEFIPHLQFASPPVTHGTLQFKFTGIPGVPYRLDWTDDVSNWTNSSSRGGMTWSSSSWERFLSFATSVSPRMFYHFSIP